MCPCLCLCLSLPLRLCVGIGVGVGFVCVSVSVDTLPWQGGLRPHHYCHVWHDSFIYYIIHSNTKAASLLPYAICDITHSYATWLIDILLMDIQGVLRPHHYCHCEMIHLHATWLIDKSLMDRQGGLRPHHYCLPVLKREEHRAALVKAATSVSLVCHITQLVLLLPLVWVTSHFNGPFHVWTGHVRYG